MRVDERRLDQRLLFALELALEQEDLEVADLVGRALQIAMTRFGGPGRWETRDVSEEALAALDRLATLRHAKLGLAAPPAP